MSNEDHHADAQHDAPWCHEPIHRVTVDKYERTTQWREEFRRALANHERKGPPPDAHPDSGAYILWKAIGAGYQALIDDLSRQLRELEHLL